VSLYYFFDTNKKNNFSKKNIFYLQVTFRHIWVKAACNLCKKRFTAELSVLAFVNS
jgi:hypothetical protein